MPMNIQTEVYIIPETDKFLFVPSDTQTLFKGVQQGKVPSSALEKATFDYEQAKETHSEMLPKGLIVPANTPAILVFQNSYEDALPKDLHVDDYVAMILDPTQVENRKGFEEGLKYTIDKSIGLDLSRDMANINSILHRTIVALTLPYNPDSSKKIETFNHAARFYQRRWGDPKIIDEEVIPTAVVNLIETKAYGAKDLKIDASFKEKWDYVVSNQPAIIPSKEKREELYQEQIEDSKQNLKTLSIVLKNIKDRFGLTEKEIPLLNGINFLSGTYGSVDASVELADLLDGESGIITMDKVNELKERIKTSNSQAIP